MLFWRKRCEQTASTEWTTGRAKPTLTEKYSRQLRWECSSYSPNFKQQTHCLQSVDACDRPEIIEMLRLPPIDEDVSQHISETSTNRCNLHNTNNDFISETTVASQTTPPKETQPQNYVVTTEHPPANQTRNEQVPFLDCSKSRPTDIQD